jgi:hypothetical protein
MCNFLVVTTSSIVKEILQRRCRLLLYSPTTLSRPQNHYHDRCWTTTTTTTAMNSIQQQLLLPQTKYYSHRVRIKQQQPLFEHNRCTTIHRFTGSIQPSSSSSSSSVRSQPQHQKPRPVRYYSNTCSNSYSNSSDNSQKNKINQNTIKVAIVGSGPSGCYTAKYLMKAMQQQQQKAQTPHYINDIKNTTTTTTTTTDTSILPWQGVQMDVVEQLPTPYGLVRYGVAPDHPEVKNVQSDYDQLFHHPSSSSSFLDPLATTSTTTTTIDDQNEDTSSQQQYGNKIRFLGNVTVGTKEVVTIMELRQLYDIVILCYGCHTDRTLPIAVSETMTTTTTTNSNQDLQPFALSAREFVAWYNGTWYILVVNVVDSFLYVQKDLEKVFQNRKTEPTL